MFIGHYALGFATRKANQLPSLAMLFIAVQLLDLLWPLFSLAGIETFTIDPGNTRITPLDFSYYPYSHSLLMAVFWGILLGGIYFIVKKNRRASLLLFVLVISHWVLDFITHRPDLPLTPFSDRKVGLGLWNYPAAEIILEIGMFAAGVMLYYISVKPERRILFWILVILLGGIHLANIFGPPPPSEAAVSWSANLLWIFIGLAWWLEKKKPLKATE